MGSFNVIARPKRFLVTVAIALALALLGSLLIPLQSASAGCDIKTGRGCGGNGQFARGKHIQIIVHDLTGNIGRDMADRIGELGVPVPGPDQGQLLGGSAQNIVGGLGQTIADSIGELGVPVPIR